MSGAKSRSSSFVSSIIYDWMRLNRGEVVLMNSINMQSDVSNKLAKLFIVAPKGRVVKRERSSMLRIFTGGMRRQLKLKDTAWVTDRNPILIPAGVIGWIAVVDGGSYLGLKAQRDKRFCCFYSGKNLESMAKRREFRKIKTALKILERKRPHL